MTELTILEIKILKLLSKQKKPVNLEYMRKKFGFCEDTLNNLYRVNYINSSLRNDPYQIGFPSFENITLSKKGQEYLVNLKFKKKSEIREKAKERLWALLLFPLAVGLILWILTSFLNFIYSG